MDEGIWNQRNLTVDFVHPTNNYKADEYIKTEKNLRENKMKNINDLKNIDIWESKVTDMSMQPNTYSKILLIWLAWEKTDDKLPNTLDYQTVLILT